MPTSHEATATWHGDLTSGKGSVSTKSGALKRAATSWSERTEGTGAEGATSPEELLAAAHASCFAMALSAGLARAGTPPKKLDVTSTVTFDKVGEDWTVVSSELEVKGEVPGIDAAAFAKAAEGAKDGCPISRALKNNVKLSVRPTLAR